MNVKKLVEDLKRHEGIRLHVYDDATGQEVGKGDTLKGHPTIGIGRNLSDRGVSEKEAKEMIHNDIDIFYKALRRIHVFNQLGEVRQRVIMNMAFNLGMPRLRLFKKMWAALEKGDYNEASKEMLDSDWHREFTRLAKEAGLNVEVTRSWELAQIMRSGRE